MIRAICLALGLFMSAVPVASYAQAAATSEQGLFAIIYRAGPAWRQGKPMQEQALGPHEAYMRRLFAEGRTYVAGPLGPDGGLILVHGHDKEEVEALMKNDPAVTSGLFVGEVRRFIPVFLRPEPLRDRKPQN